MKIRSIETIPVDVPRTARVRIQAAHGVYAASRFAIVVVRTEDGLEGLGECCPELPWTGEDQGSCCHFIKTYFAPALIGKDARRITEAVRIMDHLLTRNEYAKAAVEMALWDLAGKEAGKPLYDLWGGRVRDAVAVKFVVSGAPEHAAELAQAALANGFNFIKIKTGLGVEADLKRIRAVRKAIGDSVPLGIDSNQGWSIAEAYKALPVLEEIRCSFIEQPFTRDPLEATLNFARATRIPLVAHEGNFSRDDALRLASSRAVSIFAITPPTHGSYVATRDILGIARAASIPCLLGSTIELGIASAFMAHIGVSSPSFDGTVPSDIIGQFYHDEDITKERLAFEGSAVRPHDGPGLGVTLNPDTVAKFRVDKR
jgi:muconate cycloisomerase